jgi:hypothetical protein
MLSLPVLSLARGHSSGGISHDEKRTLGEVLPMILERVRGGGATGAANHEIRRRI